MTPGPMDFRGPIRPLASGARQGPIETTLRNQHVRPEELFFFKDHLISTGKTVRISEKTFFFRDHIIIRTKMRHFLHLFWSSQNRKSVIFELAPGPRSAHGAPDAIAGPLYRNCLTVTSYMNILLTTHSD